MRETLALNGLRQQLPKAYLISSLKETLLRTTAKGTLWRLVLSILNFKTICKPEKEININR